MYVYNKVRLGRISKRNQPEPVGWHLHEQNLFVYFLNQDHKDKRKKDRKISSNITKKTKRAN